MKEKADSIAECTQIERLWHLQPVEQNVSVTSSEIMLSHSDIGPYVHIFCPEGHHVVGPSMITCLKSGSWDDVTKPYCSASPYYGIPTSDLVLIGTIAGSSAIIIFTLTIVLAYMLCFRSRQHRGLTSRDPMTLSSESIPSTAASFKIHNAISPPSGATRNGFPISSEPGQHISHIYSNYDDSREYAQSRTVYDVNNDVDMTSSYYIEPYSVADCQVPPPPPPPLLSSNGYAIANSQRRTTSGFQRDGSMTSPERAFDEFSRNYAANWDNEYNSSPMRALPSTPHDVHIQPLYRTPGTTVF